MSAPLNAHDLTQSAHRVLAMIHAAISDDLTLQTELGDPMRAYDFVPEDAVYPYLTYGSIRSEDTGADGLIQSRHTLNLSIWSNDHSRAGLLSLLSSLTRALNAAVPPDGLSAIIQPIFTDVLRATDGTAIPVRRGLLRLSITLSEETTP